MVILSRDEALGVLHTAMVAPGLPSGVVIGIEEGLRRDSAVNLDPVQTVEQARLRRFVGRLKPERMQAVCRPLPSRWVAPHRPKGVSHPPAASSGRPERPGHSGAGGGW